MKRALMGLVWSVLIALVVTGSGCGSGSNSSVPSGLVTSAPKTFDSLVFTVSTPHGNNTRGAAIPITFTVTNTGSQAANLTFGTCDDFAVQVKQGGQTVWTSPGSICGAIIRAGSIPPGATQTYNVTWDQKDSAGNAVAPGTYTVLAQLTPYTLNGAVVSADQAATNFSANPISVSISQ